MRISDWSSDVCSSDLGGAHRSGRPEDGDGLHPISSRTWTSTSIAASGATGTSPSSRSSTPPWPGRIVPLSFTPARRLSQLSNRRSEEHTSELQSLMRISYAVFCLKKKKLQAHHRKSKGSL